MKWRCKSVVAAVVLASAIAGFSTNVRADEREELLISIAKSAKAMFRKEVDLVGVHTLADYANYFRKANVPLKSTAVHAYIPPSLVAELDRQDPRIEVAFLDMLEEERAHIVEDPRWRNRDLSKHDAENLVLNDVKSAAPAVSKKYDVEFSVLTGKMKVGTVYENRRVKVSGGEFNAYAALMVLGGAVYVCKNSKDFDDCIDKVFPGLGVRKEIGEGVGGMRVRDSR